MMNDLDSQVTAVDIEIKAVEIQVKQAEQAGDREKEVLLRKEKEQLRKEKEQLREKELLQLRSQQQGAARHHVGLSDEQAASLARVLQILEDQQPKTVTKRLSEVNSSIWQEVAAKARIHVSIYADTIPVKHLLQPTMFGWDDRVERAQADRYISYLKQILPYDSRQYDLVDVANRYPGLLSVKGQAEQLGYNFSGTTDVIVALRGSRGQLLPTVIRLVLELKKRDCDKHYYQAMVSLLLANIHSTTLKPVVILTDLNQDYTLFWLDRRTIHYFLPTSAGHALGIVSELLKLERVTSDAVVVPNEGLVDIELPMAKRQQLDLLPAAGADPENLADLQDFLEPNEFRACMAAALLQQFHNIPFVAACKPAAPPGLYS